MGNAKMEGKCTKTNLLTNKILVIGDLRKQFKDLVLGLREEFKPGGL